MSVDRWVCLVGVIVVLCIMGKIYHYIGPVIMILFASENRLRFVKYFKATGLKTNVNVK